MRKTSDGATLVQLFVTIFLNMRAQCAVVQHRSCILEVSPLPGVQNHAKFNAPDRATVESPCARSQRRRRLPSSSALPVRRPLARFARSTRVMNS